MSYLSKRARARRPALSGWSVVDAVNAALAKHVGGATIDEAESRACLEKANAATAGLDAKAMDLDKRWQPSGFYSVAQVLNLVTTTQKLLLDAGHTMDRAISEAQAPGTRDALKLDRASITRKISESSVFVDAIKAAEARGIQTLDAPGLKRWVVSSMRAAADGLTAVAYVSCMKPWWVSALATFMTYFNTVWSVAMAITGVALKLGEAVLEIPDTISTVWKLAKWGAVLGGAWWVYNYGPATLKSLTR